MVAIRLRAASFAIFNRCGSMSHLTTRCGLAGSRDSSCKNSLASS